MNVEIDNIINPIYKEIENLLENNAHKELVPFFIDYIKTHKYFTSKAMAADFLRLKCKLKRNNKGGEEAELYVRNKLRLTFKFTKISTHCKKLEIITFFNTKTHEVIDISEEKLKKLRSLYNLAEKDDK